MLLACTHTIKVARSWLILADRFFNVQRVHFLDKFEGRLSDSRIHAQVKVFFNFFKGHWWCSLSLFNLLSHTVVTLTIETLVFDEVVESLLISTNSEVLLDIFLLFFELVLIKPAENLVRLLPFPVLQAVDLGLCSLLISDVLPERIEVLWLRCSASESLYLATKGVRRA